MCDLYHRLMGCLISQAAYDVFIFMMEIIYISFFFEGRDIIKRQFNYYVSSLIHMM